MAWHFSCLLNIPAGGSRHERQALRGGYLETDETRSLHWTETGEVPI